MGRLSEHMGPSDLADLAVSADCSLELIGWDLGCAYGSCFSLSWIASARFFRPRLGGVEAPITGANYG